MSLETLTFEALKLNPSERIELAHLLIDSLSIDEKEANSDSSVLKTQLTEVKRRIENYRNGKVKTISAKDAHQKFNHPPA